MKRTFVFGALLLLSTLRGTAGDRITCKLTIHHCPGYPHPVCDIDTGMVAGSLVQGSNFMLVTSDDVAWQVNI